MASFVVMAGLVALHTSPAFGQPERTPNQTKADRLFAEGRALAKAHKLAEACERFAESDAIERTFGTAVNLGDCAEHDGRLALAWRLYDEAARDAERGDQPSQVKFARSRADALAPRLCTVVVTIEAPAAEMVVTIAGRNEPPATEIRVLVDPGDIDIAITAPNAPPLHQTLHGAAGETVSLNIPAANKPAPPSPPSTSRIPGFVVLENFDATSRAGIELTYVGAPSGDFTDAPLSLRFEAHAHFVDPHTGFGGYLRVPFSVLHESADFFTLTDEVTETDFGDIELGGLYVHSPADYANITLTAHIGITLPTAGGSELKQQTGSLTSVLAMREALSWLPSGVTAMAGVSAAIRSDRLFAHIDLGGDVNLYCSTDCGDMAPTTAIHLDAGGGVALDPFAIMLETENVFLPGNSSLHAIALSARADFHKLSFYAALIAPIGGDTSSVVDFAAVGGVEFLLQ